MPGTKEVEHYFSLDEVAHQGLGGHDDYRPGTATYPHEVYERNFRGIRYRRELGRYISEIRPAQPRKRKIWLGTYKTAEEAARAFDAGIFYTGKSITYNFKDSPFILEPLPHDLSPEQEHVEIQKKARAAAARAQPVSDVDQKLTSTHQYESLRDRQHENPTSFRIPLKEIKFPVLERGSVRS